MSSHDLGTRCNQGKQISCTLQDEKAMEIKDKIQKPTNEGSIKLN